MLLAGADPTASAPALQFSQWLQDERRSLESERGARLVDFWRHQLGTDPENWRWNFTELKSEFSGEYAGDLVATVLSEASVTATLDYGRRHRRSAFEVMAGCLLHTLRTQVVQDRVFLMTTAVNRSSEGALDMVGDCVNTVWVPVDLADCRTASSAIESFSASCRRMLRHQDAPERWLLSRLQGDHYTGFPTVPQLYFLFSDDWMKDLELPGLRQHSLTLDDASAQSGLQFYATRTGPTAVRLEVRWLRGQFSAAYVAGLVEELQTRLERLAD
jgi:hypothetical protein